MSHSLTIRSFGLCFFKIILVVKVFFLYHDHLNEFIFNLNMFFIRICAVVLFLFIIVQLFGTFVEYNFLYLFNFKRENMERKELYNATNA